MDLFFYIIFVDLMRIIFLIILMMSQLNRVVWLVKIDVDRSYDFLTLT